MKYLSLFSGIGGFELGIQYAYENNICKKGQVSKQKDIQSKRDSTDNTEQRDKQNRIECPECIGYSEIDKYAIQIYEKHFNHKNYGDITKIDTRQLPDFDLLVGGFPCQAFSIAGKRGGFDDTRGTLFFEIARILRDKRPRYFLLENVKGLLSHDSGKTIQTIFKVLTDLGYDFEWQVLNSKNHGVPQNRERIFIVGYLGGGSRPKVFPIRENDNWNNKEDEREQLSCSTITTRTGSTARGQQFLIQDKRQSGEFRIKKESPAVTSYWGMGGGNIPLKTNKQNGIRRLTPVECERLQGFPDGWTKYGVNEKGEQVEISDSQRYKCLGNAVTTFVIRDIIKKLI